MLDVYVGSVENAIVALAGNVFDCIVFNDILEHLLAPWDVLRDVAAMLLSDGGAIVASIPNIRHYSVIKSLWLEGDWRYEEAGILDRTHLRFFTRKTIGELFRNAGYKVVELQGNTIDGVPRKMKLLSKYLCRQPEDLAYKQFAVLAIKLPQS